MTVRVLPLIAAALALAGCSKGLEAPHAASAEASVPHGVVARPDANLPTKREIAALLDDWNEALRTGGGADIALLYVENGVMAPTDSNEVRSNRAEIADYYEKLLAQHPRATVNEQHIDVLDSRTATNSGVLTLDLIQEAQPTFVVVRYAFLYQKLGGKWLIRTHQMSVMPEPMTTRPPPLAELLAANEPSSPPSEPPAAAGAPATDLRPTQAETAPHR